MTFSNIAVNKATPANSTFAPQLQSSIRPSQQTNPVFRPDSLSLGNVESPYQTYSANPAASKQEPWCISDHYKITQEEILPAVQAIMQEIADADFSGMTDIEIYTWIETHYINTFGEDFMIANSLRAISPNTNTGVLGYEEVGKTFTSALFRHFGNMADLGSINRQRLYGDMSIGDIQESIREKYPENLTNKQLFLLLSELRAVGVDGGIDGMKQNYTNEVIFGVGVNSIAMTADEYRHLHIEMLNKPTSLPIIFGIYNLGTYRGSQIQAPMAKDLLIRLFGAVELENGLLQSDWYDEYHLRDNTQLKINFKPIDLESEFIQSLDEHDADR